MSSAETGESGDGDRSEANPDDSESLSELTRSPVEGVESAAEDAASPATDVEIADEDVVGAVRVADTVGESVEPATEGVESPAEVTESPAEGGESAVAKAIESLVEPGQPVAEAVEATPEVVEPSQSRMPELADETGLRAAVEAILFVVESPVTLAALAAALRKPTSDDRGCGRRSCGRSRRPR